MFANKCADAVDNSFGISILGMQTWENEVGMTSYIKGMDVSSMHEIEQLGAKFYNHGKQEDLLTILKSYDVNYIRLRLWNDPYTEDGRPYGAGTTDLPTVIAMAKRVKAAGMQFLLDYHYSDFWADPGKQTKPKAWEGLSVDELEEAVYTYTKETLQSCKEAGVLPDMVAVGNELSNGLLWPEGKVPEYDNIARFVKAGARAVRELNPAIKIMVHLDNGGNNALYREWFDAFCARGGDFDIIGLSYYPFWHGSFDDLSANMADIAKRYGKELIVAEVSMGHTTEDYATYEKLSAEQRKGMATKPDLCAKVPYPMTPEGQVAFMTELLKRIEAVPEHKGRGFFYWEPAWLPVAGSGWANEDALKYVHEAGPGGNEWANQALFDYDGNALPALKTIAEYNQM